MLDVTSRRCEHGSCVKSPKFNLRGESQGRFCDTHKEAGMINVIAMLCEQDGCSTQSSFGMPGSVRRRCKSHKEGGMVCLAGTKTKGVGRKASQASM